MIRLALIKAFSKLELHHTANVGAPELVRYLHVPVYQIKGGFALWWVTTWSVTGFAIDGAVITKAAHDQAHLAHELTHIKQAYSVRCFSLRYVLEFLWHWLHMPTKPRDAYLAISYEVEARAAKDRYLKHLSD